jgi:hypothetical protein
MPKKGAQSITFWSFPAKFDKKNAIFPLKLTSEVACSNPGQGKNLLDEADVENN